MKKSSLWLQIGVLCLGFVLLNLFAKRFVHGSIPHLIFNQMQAVHDPTLIFMGNSVVEAGARTEILKKAIPGSRPLNLAMGGIKSRECFIMFNQVKTDPADKPHAFYGFFDRQTTDPDPKLTWTDIGGNHSICYLTDVNEAAQIIAPDDPVLRWQMRLSAHFPIIIERYTLWNRIELMRRRVGELGLPKQATNSFGRVADFSGLEEDDMEEFKVAAQEAATKNVPFNVGVTKILEKAKKQDMAVSFILMPMPTLHRKRYYSSPEWRMYQAHVQKLAAQAGASFIDASTWVPDSYFVDHVHMGPSGGDIFSSKLVPYCK